MHHPAVALDVYTDARGELSAVRIGYSESSTETEIPATRLVIVAGAWTPKVFRFLFRSSAVRIPVESLGGHSLVVRSPKLQAGQVSHAVYCNLDTLSPELYARPTGVIYLAGVNSSSLALPDVATDAEPLDGPVEELKALARSFIATGPVGQNKDKNKIEDKDKDQDMEVVRTGLCFRPITSRGTPILARVDDAQLGDAISTRPGAEGGVFVATGHAFWGISLSLGTGKVMAEMMQGRKLSADISRLGL
jgi:glycine/D-amino acid oxidase-like deaminating enzyme